MSAVTGAEANTRTMASKDTAAAPYKAALPRPSSSAAGAKKPAGGSGAATGAARPPRGSWCWSQRFVKEITQSIQAQVSEGERLKAKNAKVLAKRKARKANRAANKKASMAAAQPDNTSSQV